MKSLLPTISFVSYPINNTDSLSEKKTILKHVNLSKVWFSRPWKWQHFMFDFYVSLVSCKPAKVSNLKACVVSESHSVFLGGVQAFVDSSDKPQEAVKWSSTKLWIITNWLVTGNQLSGWRQNTACVQCIMAPTGSAERSLTVEAWAMQILAVDEVVFLFWSIQGR